MLVDGEVKRICITKVDNVKEVSEITVQNYTTDIPILIEYTICQTRYLPSSAISMGFGVGREYQHYGCRWCLVEFHILQGVYRRENCLNSVMVDSFLGVMKSGLFYAEKIESVENFTKVLDEYVDV